MFQQFKNVDSAFKLSRIIAVCAVAGSFLFGVFVSYSTGRQLAQKDKTVLVIANGKIFEAFAEQRDKYWPIEITDHVKTFHNNFFSLQADDEAIKKNINKALYLADNSAAREYDNLRESGYYSSIIAANVTQDVEAEKVEVNINTTPWSFRYFGKLRIKRATNTAIRTLITEGTIRTTTPSDNNPHGLIIENWRVVENRDVNTINH